MITFDAKVCTDFAAATSREWLETNGIGGFASGTISGANNRRYHGLLTAATKPPLGRISMLSKYEETDFVGGKRFDISANSFPGTVHPKGYKLITSFRLDPFPIWTFDLDGLLIEKRIFMIYGRNAIAASWSVTTPTNTDKISLKLRPLLSFVDYHHLQHGNHRFLGRIQGERRACGNAAVRRDAADIFHAQPAAVQNSGYWYRDFEYGIEKERGFDYQEDLFQPFVLKFDLAQAAR